MNGIGSGFATVGRAVASETSGHEFESSRQKIIHPTLNFCYLHFGKDQKEEIRGTKWTILKNLDLFF